MREWETVLLDRVQRAVAEGRPAMTERAGTVPVANYVSRERLELERRHVFGRFPLLVGLSAKVRNPGDFFTHDHTGVPILVTRTREGALRAFLNVCRHRGVKVACEPAGTGRSLFSCRYHGWSYDLDGALRGVPTDYGFPELDRRSRGLVPIPAAEMFGLVFVLPQPGASLDLRAFLAPLERDLEDFGLARHVVYDSSTRTVNGNWKLMVDANLETYHIPVLHQRTAMPLFHDRLLVHDGWDPHARALLPYKPVPGFPTAADEHRGIRKHAGVLYFVFPNTFVFFMLRTVNILSTFPLDEDRCVVEGVTVVEGRPTAPVEKDFLDWCYKWYWSTIREDIEVAELAQATMRSGANREFLVGRYEFGVQRFHELLEEAIVQGEAPVAAAPEAPVRNARTA